MTGLCENKEINNEGYEDAKNIGSFLCIFSYLA